MCAPVARAFNLHFTHQLAKEAKFVPVSRSQLTLGPQGRPWPSATSGHRHRPGLGISPDERAHKLILSCAPVWRHIFAPRPNALAWLIRCAYVTPAGRTLALVAGDVVGAPSQR